MKVAFYIEKSLREKINKTDEFNFLNFYFQFNHDRYNSLEYFYAIITNYRCYASPEDNVYPSVLHRLKDIIYDILKRHYKKKTYNKIKNEMDETVDKFCLLFFETALFEMITDKCKIFMLQDIVSPKDLVFYEDIISNSKRIKNAISKRKDNDLIVSFVQKLSVEMWGLLS